MDSQFSRSHFAFLTFFFFYINPVMAEQAMISELCDWAIDAD